MNDVIALFLVIIISFYIFVAFDVADVFLSFFFLFPARLLFDLLGYIIFIFFYF